MRSHDQITDTIVRLIVALEIEPTETLRFDVGYGRLRVWAHGWRLTVSVESLCIPATEPNSVLLKWKLTLRGDTTYGTGNKGAAARVVGEIERIEHVLRAFEVRAVGAGG